MAGIINKRLSCLSTSGLLFIAISFFISLVLASSIPLQPSSVKTLFVSGEAVVLDLNGEDGDWLIETEPNRILFISLSGDGASDILKHSLKIYDGLGPDYSNSYDDLLFPMETDESLKNGEKILQHQFYSTGDTIDIRFRHSDASFKPNTKYQLKIQKAVNCPINLGGQSGCGRIFDNTSCYCSTFQPRSWANTKTFCLDNNMTFFRVDSYEEDLAVFRTWSDFGIQLWIGASDISQEGNFTWDNGGRPMSPGYTNWGPNAPDNGGTNDDEDCVHYGQYDFAWDDFNCATLYGGVCEAQP